MRLRPLGLVVTLALGILVVPLAADAQQAEKIARIGYLSGASPASTFAAQNTEAFRQGLRALGYVEGKNIVIEYRWAEGEYKRFPGLAAELVQLKVDVIVAAGGTPSVEAAKKVTKTIPIVFPNVGDPVGSGLVASLARPGGNITGLTAMRSELSGKQLELLKETIPKLSRVAVLSNPGNSYTASLLRETEAAARSLGVKLQILEARGPNDFDRAFLAMAKDRPDALLLMPDAMLNNQGPRLAGLAVKNRLPTMFAVRAGVEAGGLMAYVSNFQDLWRRAAHYVDKILKGAKPGDLPVEQATRFELVINLKTAKALGLTIPRSVLIRADQVIE